MEIPKNLQERLEALPPEDKENFLRAMKAATSPDFDEKWRAYKASLVAEDASLEATELAEEIFYAGGAALLACSGKERIVPEAAAKQISQRMGKMLVREITDAVAKMVSMVKDAVEAQSATKH